MNLSLRLRERSQAQRAKCDRFHPWNIQIRQICRACGGLGGGLMRGMGFLFGARKTFSNGLWWWFHMCKYTKNHCIIQFKWLNCIIHNLLSQKSRWGRKKKQKNVGMDLIWLATTTSWRVTPTASCRWRQGRPQHCGRIPAGLKPCLNLGTFLVFRLWMASVLKDMQMAIILGKIF